MMHMIDLALHMPSIEMFSASLADVKTGCSTDLGHKVLLQPKFSLPV